MVISKQQKLFIFLGVLGLLSYGSLLVYRGSSRASAERRAALKTKAFLDSESEAAFYAAPPAPQVSRLAEGKGSPVQTGVPGLRSPALAFLEESNRGPLLIFRGQLLIEVKDYDEAFNRIQGIATELNGYLSDFQAKRPEKDHAQGCITLRVSPSQYFQALNRLRLLGRTESENSTIQDVTRRCLSLDTRIKHKREIESRMWDSMRSRSNTVDALAAAGSTMEWTEDNLDRLETERYQLQQDILYANIRLELHEPAVNLGAAKPVKQGLFEPMKLALQNAASEVISDVSRAMYLVLVLAPWALAGYLVYRPASKGVRRLLEARRQKEGQTDDNESI